MDIRRRSSDAELQSELEEALKATFPASDPFAIGDETSHTPDRPEGRRPARIDKALVEKLAQDLVKRRGKA